MKRVLLGLMLIAAPLSAQDLADISLPDAKKEAQATALMDTIRCVVCQGQPVSGSNVDMAGDMRRIIRERIAAGESPEQVRSFLVSRFGDWISLKPQMSSTTAPLWIVPIIALLGGLFLASRRLRPRR